MPQAATVLGGFDPAVLEGADQIVVSPGVSLGEPLLRLAASRGLDLVGDIELFAREAGGRVLGITGTNGKSTVTTLVGEFARAAGIEVRVGGNLGEPALDLLEGPPAAMYVLELSSYQLETTHSLQLEAAAVLNVTPDHLDRYAGVAEYAAAKARIFERAATAVVNLDDELVVRMPRPGQRRVGFSLRRGDADFRLLVARRRGVAGRGRRGTAAALGAASARPPQRGERAGGARGRQRRGPAARGDDRRAAPLRRPAAPCAARARPARHRAGSTTPRAPTSARRSRRSRASTGRWS